MYKIKIVNKPFVHYNNLQNYVKKYYAANLLITRLSEIGFQVFAAGGGS